MVIVGDLVDGRRNRDVDDPKGNFEILIHALIHNLRIRANMVDSDVLFTLGNHDVESVLTTTKLERQHMYDNYVHASAKVFFNNSIHERRNRLMPFYYNSPYTFLEFVHQKQVQYVCVHAGIHNSSGQRIDEPWKALQEKIDRKGLQRMLPLLSMLNRGDKNDIFWTRDYLEPQTCVAIRDEPFPVIIVGHCPTPFAAAANDDEDDLCENSSSSSKKMKNNLRGCVRVGCQNHRTPKVIFVDTASSAAFRLNAEQHRDVEILKLSKTTSDSLFYYKMERQLNGVTSQLIVDPSRSKTKTRSRKRTTTRTRKSPSSVINNGSLPSRSMETS